MCVAHRVFTEPDADFRPVLEHLMRRAQRLVIGGRLLREYLRDRSVTKALLELDRRGAAKILRDDAVDSETALVEHEGMCASNDPHVIALARVTGARVLCTSDDDLTRDFKNKSLIDGPRGRVYRRRRHVHLLRQACVDRR